MKLGTFFFQSNPSAGLFGSGGLKRTLSAAFALLLAGSFSVTWFIQRKTHQAAALKAADELIETQIARIAGDLDNFFNQSIDPAVINGTLVQHLSRQDYSRLPEAFAEQLAIIPMAKIIFVGFADGEYAEAQRLGDGSIRLGRAGALTGGDLSFFRPGPGGHQMEELRLEGYDPRTRPWYRDAVSRGRLGFSEPYIVLTTGRRAVAALNPIHDGKGRLLGVTGVTLELDDFQEHLASIADSFGGYVAIFDAEQRILVSSAQNHPAAGLIGSKPAVSPSRAVVDGTPWRYRVRDYVGRADDRRFLLIALREDRFTAPLDAVGRNILMVYLVTLLVFTAFSILVIRVIGEPLRILGDEVSRFGTSLAEGNRSEGLEASKFLPILASRRDELGQLARAFTALRDDLSGTFNSLNKSLEDKEILLKEIHHRVKNNLQIITSMLSLHGSAAEDPILEEILEDLRDRVQAMAIVHEVIYSSGSFSSVSMDDYLTRLMDALSLYDRRGASVRLEVVIEPTFLPLERAIPCALVVVELATNAFKHAFPGRDVGTVRIALARRPPSLCLTVEDDGVGHPGDKGTEGMGTTIVSALVRQLGGSMNITSGPGGTTVAIAFPE